VLSQDSNKMETHDQLSEDICHFDDDGRGDMIVRHEDFPTGESNLSLSLQSVIIL
jgi:hypothetical protein